MSTLLQLDGEKLPLEAVWVDADGMYEVYDKITIDVDEYGVTEYIITDIVIDGLIVERIN